MKREGKKKITTKKTANGQQNISVKRRGKRKELCSESHSGGARKAL
jgi:hypothetical protein